MDTAPSVVIVGMSSLLVWDGFEAASARRVALAERIVPVTGRLSHSCPRWIGWALDASLSFSLSAGRDRQIAAFFEVRDCRWWPSKPSLSKAPADRGCPTGRGIGGVGTDR